MVTIEFEITQNDYTLKDAIILPDNHGLTDAQIEVLKQQRFNDWYAIITAPQPEYLLDENGQIVLDENGLPVEVINNGN